tara:strand:- start:652 stop:1383 length:732 start_codon:yes stop_codon:yes gene_type:complete
MPYNGKYIPEKEDFYKLSRSKVDFFLNCSRCFYMDRRLGISQPSGFPFNLNSAVDNLLKNEFDHYRSIKKPHPYIERLGLNAIPFEHEKLDKWRHNFSGVVYQHNELKLHLFGAVDDIWINLDTEELIVVDYKATSKNSEINLNADWQIGYKRQMEFYQYLLRNNGFKVSDTGYFVYCNGIRQKERFDEKLDFEIYLLDYTGNDGWIEKTLSSLIETIRGDQIPNYTDGCEHCEYQLNTKELN